jgi:PKD domain
MNILKNVNKFFLAFVALSLIVTVASPFSLLPARADLLTSPICTITADNLTPAAGNITENFTVTFNSGLTSTNLHQWALYANAVNPANASEDASPVAFSQVLNSTDFPSSFNPYGADFLTPNSVAESTVSGNTYHISASWDASNQENGSTWYVQLSTSDNTNDGCTLNQSGSSPAIIFRSLTIGSITVSTSPIQVDNSASASASFTDPNLSNTHTATWDWGDGITSNGTVTESNGSGSVSDNHTYTTTGVYTVTLTVTDSGYNPNEPEPTSQHGVQETSQYQYVSVYNPTSQGLFSAGHKFTSPAGAYTQSPNLSGDVTFGLVYKYQGTVPTSDKQFTMDFKAANLTFNATSVSALVISNGMATLTGSGTINGSGNYNFLVIGVDGGGVRVQITDPSNNNNALYDTQPGAVITATPTTQVSGHVLAHN